MESTTLADLGAALPSINSQETLQGQITKVKECLAACKKERQAMGKPRNTPEKQRRYLMKRVIGFQRLASAAVEGRYGANRLFIARPEYRLISQITNLTEHFRSGVRKRGHTYYFKNESDDGLFDATAGKIISNGQRLREWAASCEELSEILKLLGNGEEKEEVGALAKPEEGMMKYLATAISELPKQRKQLETQESLFTKIFHYQAKKWSLHANYLMKSTIITIHRFISQLLLHVFPNNAQEEVCTKVQDLIIPKVLRAYKRAWAQKDFLVKMELECHSLQTYNSPQFEAAITRIGRQNFRTTLIQNFDRKKFALGPDGAFNAAVVEAAAASNSAGAGIEEVVEDIHDLLCAYYTIATERLIDNICRQAVTYFLLEAEDGPVKLLSVEFIEKLGDEQLERVAGEDETTTAARLSHIAKTKYHKEVLKVLRQLEREWTEG
ncbi:hypothetical protein B0T20DRAFT_469293 [Sordaria brevicollis]|uniref:GED domain-containing protein n=1 Tax=Sordaria brevicollis TaxID=83679 RepID=A0AAE0PEF4_SORBR|nr:hypothetical protein B0T20DRAFT_469293 [Sordaria brevicollis]